MDINTYNLMRHAIGFNRKHIKRNKLITYRNYFCAAVNTPDCLSWLDLCSLGFAEQYDDRNRSYYFTLTAKGIEYVSKQEQCKIVIGD